MKKFIGLVDVGLSVCGGKYGSYISNIFLGIYEAEDKDKALELIKAKYDNSDSIRDLGSWVDEYGYEFNVKEV